MEPNVCKIQDGIIRIESSMGDANYFKSIAAVFGLKVLMEAIQIYA